MVPGSPNTGPLLKNGTRLGAASTKERGDVEEVLFDTALQEVVDPCCDWGMRNALGSPARLWTPKVLAIDIGGSDFMRTLREFSVGVCAKVRVAAAITARAERRPIA